ncbi:hypothetical protein [Pseudomonas silensiensis]|uniref:hypothetical protein n=1 Tax=Pseudomonas silensiensis TaxID=2991049 RepID=UPI003D1DCA7F
MDLTNVYLGKSAQFYKVKKRITKKKISEVFAGVAAEKIGGFLIRTIKEEVVVNDELVLCSAIAYKIISEPSFLDRTAIREEKYAFALIVEYDSAVAIIKKHISSLEKKFSDFLDEFEYEKFTNFQGRNDPEYEKVTMSNMAISDAVIRSRAYEARRLNGILSSNASSRAIPQSFRIKVQGDTITLTPNASRVTLRDKRSDINEIIKWAIATITEIRNLANKSEFINSFASPITLEEIIQKGFVPIALFINLDELDELIRSGASASEIKILRGGVEEAMTPLQMNRLFDCFKTPAKILAGGSMFFKGQEVSGTITLQKRVASFKSKITDSIVLYIENEPKISLTKYINSYKPFSIMFNTPQYAYFGRECFEDKKLLNNLPAILSIFNDGYDFSGVRSEKEKNKDKKHSPNIDKFPDLSLFRKVEDLVCLPDGVTVCDDMNDEWADHIFFEPDSSPPAISFIHSKFVKGESYGASSFHEVVAQGLKNIGRTFADVAEFKEKHDRDWAGFYESTKITRIRDGKKWADIENALNTITANQNSVRKIVLATPFLKKSVLKTQFDELQRTGKCRPHYIQLIWLINTFIGACKEYGVQPHVLCNP